LKQEGQNEIWDKAYKEDPCFFGHEASFSAKWLLGLIEDSKQTRLLELGGGQGRDSLYLASHGMNVTMIDCSSRAVSQAATAAAARSLLERVHLLQDDLERGIPFPDGYFDACFSHMFFCMPFSPTQLEGLFSEIRRVLKPKGLHVFSVRNTNDAHYRQGISLGEGVYRHGRFPVLFFDREMIAGLSYGFTVESVLEFQEGELPRTLFLVVARKREP